MKTSSLCKIHRRPLEKKKMGDTKLVVIEGTSIQLCAWKNASPEWASFVKVEGYCAQTVKF